MRFLLLFLTLTLNASEHPPNIVLLLADDLGYGELGSQGNLEIPTPHIDSIAKNGVRFTQGYVTAAFCSASRAGMMTGRYQTRFGYEFNPIGDHNEDPLAGLPRSERTLARQSAFTTRQSGQGILVVIADRVELVSKTRLVAAGHHARPRGAAERGRHVPLRKAHAILGNRINVRRGNLQIALTP